MHGVRGVKSLRFLPVLFLAAGALPAADKNLPLPGEVFTVAGRTAFVIRPDRAGEEKTPWVWYAPTLRNLPGPEERWMFERFLAAGVAIAGVDVGESYGSPEGRAGYTALYEDLVGERGMAERAVLLARSRGGLMLYNWAADHPGKVAGIAGIYPVCNLASYPGLKRAAGAYGLDEKGLAAALGRHNPVERLAPLADAEVPIFHIHGDRDRVVPLRENSGLVAERYRAQGGRMTLEVVAGGGHDMSRHWFTSQALVDFVIERATGSNAFARSGFATKLAAGERQTLVAYGTSLTAGGAWVGQLKAALDKAYPGQATVINSGRGAMWSTWGVENLDQRVIAKNPDTVFIEFGINDAFLRYKTSVARARTNLVEMIDRIEEARPGCEIVLMTMNPPIRVHLERRPNIEAYYGMYREVAAERGLRLIDHEPRWRALLESDPKRFDELVPDGIHPGAAGCGEVITPAIWKGLGLDRE